jgi:hypothetical protein
VLAKKVVPAAVILDSGLQRQLLLGRLPVEVNDVRIGDMYHPPAVPADSVTPVGFLQEKEVLLIDETRPRYRFSAHE